MVGKIVIEDRLGLRLHDFHTPFDAGEVGKIIDTLFRGDADMPSGGDSCQCIRQVVSAAQLPMQLANGRAV